MGENRKMAKTGDTILTCIVGFKLIY